MGANSRGPSMTPHDASPAALKEGAVADGVSPLPAGVVPGPARIGRNARNGNAAEDFPRPGAGTGPAPEPLTTVHGEPSYSLGNRDVELFVTRRGGHLGPVRFRLGRRWVKP